MRAVNESTAQGDFRRPILKMLAEYGGALRRPAAIRRLEQVMSHRLTAFDRERTVNGPIRWVNRADFERNVMVNKDALLLKPKETRFGTWELSPKGWESVLYILGAEGRLECADCGERVTGNLEHVNKRRQHQISNVVLLGAQVEFTRMLLEFNIILIGSLRKS